MVEFVMPTTEELGEQLLAQRREVVAYFDEHGWTPKARKLVKRMDRLIYRYEDQ